MVKSLVGSRRMTQKNHHGNKCAEKDDQSFGMREEKAEDGRESADYKQKRVMDINRVTDKNCKSRKKDLESEYRFDCEDEEVTFNVYNIDMEILELIITHSDTKIWRYSGVSSRWHLGIWAGQSRRHRNKLQSRSDDL
ncbi:hypothetical protein OsJ_02115 [Oryza sativa Japonica Group]|nr:hypothetical protein OsJ_02115 [Oryza sativa Japonica Group]